MKLGFNLESYLQHSQKVDISDLDFSQASRYPLSDDEIHALTYMMDIEGHTIVYLKNILSTCAVRDTDTTAFLSCWAYEEFYHSRALAAFLRAAGVELDPQRFVDLQKTAGVHEWIENTAASFICHFLRHFHGVYLTWGAISELTTLEGYGAIADRTANPILAELLRRLAKDERRHFAFYYAKGRQQLQHPNAQRLARFIIKHFWLPVGGGVKPDSEVAWIAKYILGGAQGKIIAERIDATISKLPGFDWFDGLTRTRRESLQAVAEPAGQSAAGLLGGSVD